jgi:hypothetical protein
VLECDRVRIQSVSEDPVSIVPVRQNAIKHRLLRMPNVNKYSQQVTREETHLVDLSLQERVLDVPCRSKECEREYHELVLP